MMMRRITPTTGTSKTSCGLHRQYAAVFISILLAAKVSGFASLSTRTRSKIILLPPQQQCHACRSSPTNLRKLPLERDRNSRSRHPRPSSALFGLENEDEIEIKSASGKAIASFTLGLVLLFSAPLLPANAGFGPSSRAVTSPTPNLIAPNVQAGDVAIGNNKLKQLIGSTIDGNRLQQFQIQLDNLAEELLKNLPSVDEEEPGVEGEEKTAVNLAVKEQREAELEKARVLQQQIFDRERLLAKLEKEPYWFNYMAAFVGSLASTLVMHPVDTIKTRAQIKNSKLGDDGEEEDEGIGNVLSLYEGLSGNILKEGPPSALYLGVYESAKYALLPKFGAQSVLLVYLISGAAGEMVGSIVRAPAEAIKSTVQSGLASSFSEAALQVLGTADSRANIVRAWSSSIWRDVPFGAIQLAIFELTKSSILNNPEIDFDSSSLLSEALIGAFAGGVGALLTNPFDIITTRIITQEVEGDSEPLGVVEMGKKLYDEGGPAAFLVGWGARVGYWAPAISIFLSCYCSVRQAGITHNWFTG